MSLVKLAVVVMYIHYFTIVVLHSLECKDEGDCVSDLVREEVGRLGSGVGKVTDVLSWIGLAAGVRAISVVTVVIGSLIALMVHGGAGISSNGGCAHAELSCTQSLEARGGLGCLDLEEGEGRKVGLTVCPGWARGWSQR